MNGMGRQSNSSDKASQFLECRSYWRQFVDDATAMQSQITEEACPGYAIRHPSDCARHPADATEYDLGFAKNPWTQKSVPLSLKGAVSMRHLEKLHRRCSTKTSSLQKHFCRDS